MIPGSPARFMISLVLLLNLAGCATVPEHVAVPPDGTMATEVFVGSQVRILKNDGSETEFRVLEVTPTGLRGEDGWVAYQEMRSLAVLRRDYSAVGLVLGIAAAIVGIALAGQSLNLAPLAFDSNPNN